MKRMLVLLIFGLLVFGVAYGQESPVLWKKTVCENVRVQKTVESVYVDDGTLYAGCGYVDNIKGVLWYRENISAFSLNGTELWTQDVGFVRKIEKINSGILVGTDISRGPSDWFGTLGKVWLLSENGSIVTHNITFGSFFDFDSDGEFIYIGDGWWIGEGKANETWGRVYKWKVEDNKFDEEWFIELNGTIGRVRVGDVIYAGAGAPSGYTMKHYFGYIYGISKDGRLLWKIDTTWWVRDLEIWKGNAIVGTGFDNVAGKVYLVDKNGEVKWQKDLFYIEDIEVSNHTAYIGGVKGQEGKLVALDLTSGRIEWEVSFPYRVKVVKEYGDYLLVGTGKFSYKQEKNQTVVYSEGRLYVVSADNGKILESFDTGYVRSISIGKIVGIGTGSGEVYAFDPEKLIPRKNSICGVGFLMMLLLIGALLDRKGG